MFCPNCGFNNPDGSAFCQECGTRFSNEQQNPNQTIQQQPVNSVQQQVNQQPAANQQPVNNQQQQFNNQQTYNYQQPNAQYQQPQQAPAQRGCFGSAWDDIKSSPNWFKRMLFLGLMNFFPGFSTGITGYALKWGESAAKGEHTPLPTKTFDNKAFLNGLIELVTWMIYGSIFTVGIAIAFALSLIIPLIGFLIAIAIIVFTYFLDSYTSLASMRGAVLYDLGRAFDFKEIKKSWNGGIGSMFGCYILPKLICGAIVAAVVIILAIIGFSIAAGIIGSNINSLTSSSSKSSNSIDQMATAVNSIFGLLKGLGVTVLVVAIIVVVAGFVSSLLNAFEKVLRYRAFGYWVYRHAPEWTTDEYKESMRC